MNAVSMAYDDKEKIAKAQEYKDGPAPDDMRDYPWGLTITLTHSEMQKLGLGRDGLQTGQVVAIMGTAQVKSTGAEMVNGIAEKSATLQIQTLGLGEPPQETSRASVIYGENNG